MTKPIPVLDAEDYRQLVGTKWLMLAVLSGALFANSLLAPLPAEVTPWLRGPGSWLEPGRTTGATLALQRSLGLDAPWAYHLVNVVLHTLSGLVLFGLVCRLLFRQVDQPRVQEMAPWIAFVIALVWLLHPLQTQSVTPATGRPDLIAGLSVLFALYSTVRGAERPDDPRALMWYAGAILATAVGMGEAPYVGLTPLLVALLDRTYLAGSWTEVGQQRWGLYLGLLLAAGLVVLGLPGLDTTTLAGQPAALGHYLGLVFWPRGLSHDYSDWPATLDVVALGLVTVLVLASVVLMLRWPRLGYPAVFVWLTLLPASLVAMPHPVQDARMYLPLGGIAVLVVLLGLRLTNFLEGRVAIPEVAGLLVALPVLAGLGFLTFQRNTVHYSPVTLWADTVAHRPGNVRAELNLAGALFQVGQFEPAGKLYRKLVETPDLPREQRTIAARNLAITQGMTGAVAEAVAALEAAEESPESRSEQLQRLGLLLSARKDNAGAEVCFAAAVRLQPERAEYHFDLAVAQQLQGKKKEADAARQAGLKLDPEFLKRKR